MVGLKPFDPRPIPSRRPEDVPLTIISNAGNTTANTTGTAAMSDFAEALATAQACAIDTETVYSKSFPAGVIGPLRVVSAATRDSSGTYHSWVVDVRAVDVSQLAQALSGVKADAWNASFDAHVIERDVYGLGTGTLGAPSPLTPPAWWDVMLADALLHQGLSGFDFYHSLAWASEWYLGLRAQGKGTTQLSFTADDELSQEQLRYAAADAIETLWVGEIVRDQLAAAGLEEICQLEQGARPFLDQMQRTGLAVDQQGWQTELERLEQHRQELTTQLANLTGGGQADLFGEQLRPNWNPNSEYDVRAVLNHYAPDAVRLWVMATHGEKRPLNDADSMGAMVLSAIGGEICETLLALREATKIVSTYGEGLLALVRPDGRFHSSYLQVVGTNTGRLASRNPNAQNLTPRLKPFIRPAPGSVFVYADLSQAELRFAAQLADDKKLQDAFVRGLDIHDATATSMFGVDMADLRTSDKAQHELMRTKAKRINFGILYGLRAAGLARTLTNDGVFTERHEAEKLIETYLETYPGIGAWVRDRDDYISGLAATVGAGAVGAGTAGASATGAAGASDAAGAGGAATTLEVDWALTLRLHELFPQVDQARRQLREQMRRHYTAEEVDERLRLTGYDGASRGSAGQDGADHDQGIAEIAWCLSFSAPVVLAADGQPLRIDSRTLAGRRQQFTIRTDGLLEVAAEIVATSPKPLPRQTWELALKNSSVSAPPDTPISKVLENRQLRRATIEAVATVMGTDKQTVLLKRALSTRIEQLANAYRNAPIQGGVADVMLDAFARLHHRLSEIDGASGVQTVHDSVVVECLETDSETVAVLVRDTLEEAMQHWCPDVPAVVDADIRASLSDKDVIRSI